MFATLRYLHEPGFARHGKFGFIGAPDYPEADLLREATFLHAEIVALHSTPEAASEDAVRRAQICACSHANGLHDSAAMTCAGHMCPCARYEAADAEPACDEFCHTHFDSGQPDHSYACEARQEAAESKGDGKTPLERENQIRKANGMRRARQSFAIQGEPHGKPIGKPLGNQGGATDE